MTQEATSVSELPAALEAAIQAYGNARAELRSAAIQGEARTAEYRAAIDAQAALVSAVLKWGGERYRAGLRDEQDAWRSNRERR